MQDLPTEGEAGPKLLGRFWTIPNMLSIARIFITIPITYLILTDGPILWTLWLIAIAVATDGLDGAVARWSKSVSEWGKVLDPLADKIAAAAVVLALVIKDQLPLWFLLIIVIRDVLILIGGAIAAHRLRIVLVSMLWGKVAVLMLSLTVLWAILEADKLLFDVSLWVTTVLFIYSFVLYVIRFIHVMGDNADANGEESETDDDASSTYVADSVETEPQNSN